MPTTVFINVTSAFDLSERPRYAQLTITDTFIARTRVLQRLVIAHQLAEVAEHAYPDLWGGDDNDSTTESWRMESEMLVVSNYGFAFRGCLKHTDFVVETECLPIDELLAGIAAGQRVFGELDPDDIRRIPDAETVG